MHPTKAIGFLGISPIFQSSACRLTTLFSQQDVNSHCLAFNNSAIRGDLRWPIRHSSTQFSRLSTTSSSRAFSFRIGAAFSAKNTRFNTKTDTFSFDPTDSHNEIVTGRPRSGQDAFFVSKLGRGNNVAFGVADGVGGWITSGIDSAHFSHGLCRSMALIARDAEDPAEAMKVQDLLYNGYTKVVADRSISGGGSTACIAVGKQDGKLEVANLGDSGFVQLRLNAVHHSSNPQTHAFNTPYQLSIIPPKVLARARAFGGKPLSDYPRDASVTNHQVRHGDVLVFATDGVWDNLSSHDLLKIVSEQMQGFQAWTAGEKGLSVSEKLGELTMTGGIPKKHENTLQDLLAVTITGEAKAASLNTKADGPFAREVQKFYPHEDYHGGKVDDICVIVAIVIKDTKSE